MAEEQIGSGRRSVRSVPASDERTIGKALRAGADEVVLDLEGAVAPEQKDHARGVLTTFPWDEYRDLPLPAVRVNAPHTMVSPRRGGRGPGGGPGGLGGAAQGRVTRRHRVRRAPAGRRRARRLRPPAVQALVETARGLARLDGELVDEAMAVGARRALAKAHA
jgi:citrate lyase beta subunit